MSNEPENEVTLIPITPLSEEVELSDGPVPEGTIEAIKILGEVEYVEYEPDDPVLARKLSIQ